MTMSIDPSAHRSLVDLLYEVAHRAPSGKSFTQIAELMNKPYSTLASELNAGIDTHKFGVGDLLLLMELAESDAPVDFLAQKRGGVFVKMPRIKAKGPIDQASIKAVKEFGELMAAYGQALEDGKLKSHERKEVLKEGYEAIEAVMALLRHVEDMEISE
jgi:hypothetical protein